MTKNIVRKPQTVELEAGAQCVINGALVTARTPCVLDVGSGGCVIAGRALWRPQKRSNSPHEELYFAVLDAGADAEAFAEARYRLFALLAQVVTYDRTHEAQRECACCASALNAGDIQDAIASAARLVSDHKDTATRRARVPGTPRRQRVSRIGHELRVET